jgi:hypothetical protein
MSIMQEANTELHNGARRYITVALAVLGAGTLLTAFSIGVAASSAPAPSSGLEASTAVVAASTPITLPSPCWRIGVITDGLHRLTYATMDAAGVPVTGADPDDIHLLWRGQEVALHEVGDGDSTFESDEAFLFYAQKFHGSVQDEKYTDENVYWLYVDAATPGLRMNERSVAPGEGGQPLEWYTATAYAEENLIYWARHFDAPETDTTWFWDWIFTVASPVTGTYPLTLTEPALHTYTATVVVEVAARTTAPPQHRIRLTVNDTMAGEGSWSGKTGAVFTLPVASTAIVSGGNDMKVAVLTTTSSLVEQHRIYIDRFELSYRRQPVAEDDALYAISPLSGSVAMTFTDFATSTIYLYDVSHPLTPTRLVDYATSLSGTSYIATLSDTSSVGTAYLVVADDAIIDVSPIIYYPANDLVSPADGADEIIIVPTEFLTAVQPLSALRRSQGLRVHVVDVNDVYALFNGGIVHPEAIRSFVAYAYANWPGDTLQYLLLFGDGDMNPKGYNPASYGEHAPTLIPPYLEFADPDQGEVAVDSRYGDVNWDGMPEVMVGRIPAETSTQAEDVIAKILAYETEPISPWMSRIIMTTDNGASSPEGFEAVADRLVADFVPQSMDVYTIHIRDYCGAATPSNQTTPCPSATLALTQTWSQGAMMLTYVGHAGVHRWGHEKLLLNTQMTQLTNSTGLPFLLSLDCWDGNWMWPVGYPFQDATDARSMGEWATTVLTDRGAIAAFGPSGLAYAGAEEVMARAMYQALFEDHVYRIGDLTQVGREAISASHAARTYTLLGDPAMELRRMPADLYLPLIARGE